MNCEKYYDAVGNPDEHIVEIRRFKKTLPHIISEGTLLDVGCGPGHWLKFLYENTQLSLEGSDVSQIRLNAAIKNLKGTNIELKLADTQNLPYATNSFNQVTALEVIEHVPDWKESVNELIRVASKKVIITVPYKEKRISSPCNSCGETIYQFGHLHSFSEKDFLRLNIHANIKFHTIFRDYGAFFKKITNKLKHEKNNTNTEFQATHPEYTCPSCYNHSSITKEIYTKNMISFAQELITLTPHWLIVEIEKQK
ncbi:MAG: class I SAM-dependent methyltransferase [Candidatus Nanoarchaeia archaeon]